MLKLHKRLSSFLCGIFLAAVLFSAGSSLYAEELVKGFPEDFNFRSLIRATDSEETLEFCAFCGPTRYSGAYVVSFNVPGVLNIDNSSVFDGSLTCLPTDVYFDGKGVNDPLTIYQIYQSRLIEDTVGFLSVYYTEDFDKTYFSKLGDTKMAPLSTLSKGDKVYMAAFDSPDEIITDYGYVDSIQKSDKTFIVKTNEQWVQNNNITWVGAPVMNKNGEVVGVLMPLDQENPNRAMMSAMDEVINYLEDECFLPVYNEKTDSTSKEPDSSSSTGKDNNKNDGKSDKNMEDGTATSTVIIFIVIAAAVIGAIAAVIIVAGKKKKNTAPPPPQNYGQPVMPVNQSQGYSQQMPPINQQQSYGQQMPPVNQQPNYSQQTPVSQQQAPPVSQQQAPPVSQQNYQIFNSQDSLEKNQVPATTYIKSGLTLKCVGGALNGSSYSIEDTLCIGSNYALCNVIYPENTPGISSMHCKITVAGGQAQLTDMGSYGGTFINGVQILPNVPYPMPVGSSFYVGSPENAFIITE